MEAFILIVTLYVPRSFVIPTEFLTTFSVTVNSEEACRRISQQWWEDIIKAHSRFKDHRRITTCIKQ
jgi:hypothetical protein